MDIKRMNKESKLFPNLVCELFCTAAVSPSCWGGWCTRNSKHIRATLVSLYFLFKERARLSCKFSTLIATVHWVFWSFKVFLWTLAPFSLIYVQYYLTICKEMLFLLYLYSHLTLTYSCIRRHLTQTMDQFRSLRKIKHRFKWWVLLILQLLKKLL